ncbi:hypothetical protein I3F58_11090 [Streptomyces sp. MUM 203J]|uniref:hypothetical protein n=1 Tax=Streptomyces sp. MUM 203J TaxID=2791990 RepID=UPI001F03F642|nr:hypothetical protein [Streptomyces sp. MUM 203J]MCH0540103.1 hypothetical protein [Streptomyces sp. MUM 203J]
MIAKHAVRHWSVKVGTIVTATAAAVAFSAGPASAETILRWYSYTTQGAKKCNSDANLAGPGYYCTTVTVTGTKFYALAR